MNMPAKDKSTKGRRKRQDDNTASEPAIVNAAPVESTPEPAPSSDDTGDSEEDEPDDTDDTEDASDETEQPTLQPWDKPAEGTAPWAAEPAPSDDAAALSSWVNAGGVGTTPGATGGTTSVTPPTYAAGAAFVNPFAPGGPLSPEVIQKAQTAVLTGVKMCEVQSLEGKPVGAKGYQVVIRWKQKDTGNTSGTTSFWLMSTDGTVNTTDIQQWTKVAKVLGVPMDKPERYAEAKGKTCPYPIDFTYSKDGAWLRGAVLMPSEK